MAYWASTRGFVNVFCCYAFVCYVIIILTPALFLGPGLGPWPWIIMIMIMTMMMIMIMIRMMMMTT